MYACKNSHEQFFITNSLQMPIMVQMDLHGLHINELEPITIPHAKASRRGPLHKTM